MKSDIPILIPAYSVTHMLEKVADICTFVWDSSTLDSDKRYVAIETRREVVWKYEFTGTELILEHHKIKEQIDQKIHNTWLNFLDQFEDYWWETLNEN